MFAWTNDGLRQRTRALEDIITGLITWLDREADDGLAQLLKRGDGEIVGSYERRYLLGMVFAFRAGARQGRELLKDSAAIDDSTVIL